MVNKICQLEETPFEGVMQFNELRSKNSAQNTPQEEGSLYICGQSYKASMIVNYDSRVVIWGIFKWYDSRVVSSDHGGFIRLATGLQFNHRVLQWKETKAGSAQVVSCCVYEKLKKYAAHELQLSLHV